MKKTTLTASLLALVVFLVFCAAPLFAFAGSTAAVTINPNIPGVYNVSTAGPCGWIVNFYNFALIMAGILAFGAIVFGGFKYATSAGNASKQSEGRSWIWSALLGVLLLAAAYLVLHTINPNLTNCSLPSLSGISAGLGGGGGAGGGGGSPGGGGGGTPSSGVTGQTTGLTTSAITDLNDLSKNCGCSINVTSGVRTNVAQGACTHSNGCKADIAPTTALTNYIMSLPSAGTRGDGAALYKAPDGAIYANELTRPTNCGANCGWTGGHWDMSAGS